MKKVMVVVVLLVVALIAAPAIAQNESTEPGPPPGEGPGDGPEAPLPKAFLEPPLPEDPAPEDPTPEGPALEIPAPDVPPTEPTVPETPLDDGGPVSDPSDEGTIPGPGSSPGPGPGNATSTDIDSDPGEGPRGNTRDEDDDERNEDEIVDDEVEAEAREDRIADRIFANLKDGKKDEDKDDEDKDDEDKDKDEVKQNQDQDADSGDVDQDADVINTGDNVNQCVGILQVANTGNAQNATGITQFDSETDEIELEDGSEITLTPQLVVDCRQIILQIVMGERPNESKYSNARLREAIQPRSGAALANRTGAGVIVPSSRSGVTAMPKVLSASSAGQPKTLARSLPRTGGSYATLLGLGTGVLLVGGGLLVRRLAR
jgi:hypothetical protein